MIDYIPIILYFLELYFAIETDKNLFKLNIETELVTVKTTIPKIKLLFFTFKWSQTKSVKRQRQVEITCQEQRFECFPEAKW